MLHSRQSCQRSSIPQPVEKDHELESGEFHVINDNNAHLIKPHLQLLVPLDLCTLDFSNNIGIICIE